MGKRILTWVLLAAMLLSGCSGGAAVKAEPKTTAPPTTVVTEPPLKSYTGTVNDAVVAQIGDIRLTNRELQVWYWAEAAQYRQENHQTAPDFSLPLDTQPCGIDEAAETWQEYFLWEALNSWHTAQALLLQSQEIPMPTEEAYKPFANLHEEYMTGMPATEYLYGYHEYYRDNTMHRQYLAELPEKLAALAAEKGYTDTAQMARAAFGTGEEALNSYARLYNQSYMYFTAMSYYLTETQQLPAEAEVMPGDSVDIRHILLIPEGTEEEPVTVGADGKVTCTEEAWSACEAKAQQLLKECVNAMRKPEHLFAEKAVAYSKDTGTALDGGAYHGIRRGVLMEELDTWCFQADRSVGDTAVIRSDYGVHILYFSGSLTAQQEADLLAGKVQQLTAFLEEARQAHPMEADYSKAVLGEAQGTVAAGELLYPDVAHERFPEVPLYLQRDYPGFPYGYDDLAKIGCGITTLAMLASYMTDDELTPPELAVEYNRYGSPAGTDGTIFAREVAGMGFYLKEVTSDNKKVKAALQDGLIVVSVHGSGYWTSFGHYLVLEKITEDDMVQVRDSNVFNYKKLPAHRQDLHKWVDITTTAGIYWIYLPKITNIPACSRCGSDEAITDILLTEDYLCHKCQPALLRRETYLGG